MGKEHYYTITEASRLIRAQKLSPVQLVTASLERIEMMQPQLNAFITVLKNQALADAKQAETEIKAGKWRGPLHGIPVAIKDMYDTAGIRTTAAFELFKNRVPQKDANIVTKLKAASAIIVGKTNMHTLAMGTTSLESCFGPVHNPWNMAYIAGGSSGGSAAAVAAGMCCATIDTDALGSCRLPAACCGVAGYKCTWGLIDNSGILEGEQGVDEAVIKLATAAITTRSIEDTALVCDVVVGWGFSKKFKETPAKRIGKVNNFDAPKSVRDSFDAAVAVFKRAGYEVQGVAAPLNETLDMSRSDEHRKAANKTIFKDVDVLVLPTNTTEVPTVQAVAQDPLGLSSQNTFFANYFALPAVSVPCGFDENGLPIGLQIVGKQQDDAGVLAVAAAFQHAAHWAAKPPKM